MVLGIESSCDETGIGLVSEGKLLGQALASSMEEHARFGGVVPEVAARAHLESFGPALRTALDNAGIEMGGIDAVAVTSGPGLASSLTVGVAAAKAIAVARSLPLYAVHHAAGHVAADTLEHGPLPSRCVVLIVSGGHTSLLLVHDLAVDPIEHLGDTLDDAAGESFDKVARLLGLGYPGGPAVSKVAADGDPHAVRFPRPLLDRGGNHRLAFSFSGLKTATARHVERHHLLGTAFSVADIAASFQEAVVDVLTAKAVRACADTKAATLVMVGGVAANGRLREIAETRCAAAGIELRVPKPALCTDNGAMIAAVGDLLVRADVAPSGLGVDADPSALLQRSQLFTGH
ncbi:MAG: tRNA (adenosine(37)-N6)-threonylcarbamoyltransferase complex transferase subunit TsaD [Actinomycetota bacterium]